MLPRLMLLLALLSVLSLCADPGEDDQVQTVPGYGSGGPRVFSNYLYNKNNLTMHYILV